VRSVAGAGLLRPTLTLLAGGALAQALPLIIGPWLTRLYLPAEFGQYHLFAAVAANVAVIACARYEFALPIAANDAEAAALRALCLRLLALATLVCVLGGGAWLAASGERWTLWLPAAVAVLGALSLATLLATRARRFTALAVARVLQHGGGAMLQAFTGLWHWGVQGLIVAPIGAALAALAWLGLAMPTGTVAPGAWREVARRHREFPLLNTPHAFLGALQDTVTIGLISGLLGAGAAGSWGLAARYLKAPATLVGSALSQALYPRLAATGPGATAEGRALVRQAMRTLATIAAPMVVALWIWAPDGFVWIFGTPWREAGELARALALYIGVHFVASPLAVVTMAWQAQHWALRLAVIGQLAFVAALAVGLVRGQLVLAGWTVSAVTSVYFGFYFWKLAHWPLAAAEP
jgi:O-antigen/teichoic acid export membrane protein